MLGTSTIVGNVGEFMHNGLHVMQMMSWHTQQTRLIPLACMQINRKREIKKTLRDWGRAEDWDREIPFLSIYPFKKFNDIAAHNKLAT
jgi:hypothetical protein